MPVDYNATLISKKVLYEGLEIIKVKPDFELKPFQAGQFGTLGLKASSPAYPGTNPPMPEPPAVYDPEKMIRRAYSVASSPNDLSHLEFYIVMVPEGELTPRLCNLKEGDRLWVGPKLTGKFVLEHTPETKDVLLVSTGTGLAPYMSMVRTHFRPEQKRKFIVIHGVRTSKDLGYIEELKALAKQNPKNFFYLPMITRPEDSPVWDGLVGRINDHVSYGILEKECKSYLDPERMEVYLCGNPAMIKGMIKILEDKGYTVAAEAGGHPTIHKEDYW